MAYIIAHGTVNGYNKVFLPSGCGDEIQFITDIRAEFDNTSTMLEKPMGYLLQMSPNGVWISVVKLLFDGERSGNGPGFFAFSAFLPTLQFIEGAKLKQILDGVMTKYLSMLTKEYFTQNIGIDWSFVQQASIELDSLCKPRTKHVTINFSTSDKFAYVAALTNEQIIQYLGKPFQPEYGAYKAVFVGTDIQNPNRQSTYSLLNIDVENEVYDIIWIGDTHDYPHIPKTIRKNQIDSHSCVFSKKHYESREVLLSEGSVDNVNSTITIHVPRLNPLSYLLKFIINHPEGVKAITATSKTAKTSLVSTDNEMLEFIGEQVEMQWHITIQTNDNFLSKEFDIVPYDNIENGYGISLVEVQITKVQILYEGKIDTGNQRQKIKIYNKQTFTSERGDYNGDSNSIEFRIPATDDFESIYSITLQEEYKNLYDLNLGSINTPGFIVLTIKKKDITQVQRQDTVKNQDKQFRVYVPINLADSSITYTYSRMNFKLANGLRSGDSIVYTINVPDIHRNEVTFSIDGKALKVNYASENHTTITIQGFDSGWNAIVYRIGKYQQLLVISSIAVLVIVLLACATLFALDSLGYIEVEEWLGKNDTTSFSVKDSATVGTGYGVAPYSAQSDTYYIELNRVLIAQKETWNYDAISAVVSKYDALINDGTISVNSEEYPLYKQLVWLQCRKSLNEANFSRIEATLIDKEYPDSVKQAFLREVVNSSTDRKRIFADKINKDQKFNNKTYSEIVSIWESCKTPIQNNQSTNRSEQQNNASNNNQTSSDYTTVNEEEV